MTLHLSARLAWHMDGWNGRVCRQPVCNTYCVGPYSYPGDLISEKRQLSVEEAHAGKPIEQVPNYIPPCIYSANAFGDTELTAHSDPPDFFRDGAKPVRWPLPPATVCIWPYEEMYREDVTREGGGYDYQERLTKAKEYFSSFEPDRSLIFYCSNYSNPFSEDDAKRYVVVGISSLKTLGELQYFEKCSPEIKRKYAGGFVWQMNVTSNYPAAGLRLPYQLYMDRPEVMEKLLFVPENPRNFKYGTRTISDDEALSLVERFIDIVSYLQSIGDRSEDWESRLKWLQSQSGSLWTHRGLYPGLGVVLEHLQFEEAIPRVRKQADDGIPMEQTRSDLFAFLEGEENRTWSKGLDQTRLTALRRRWKLQSDEEQKLLGEVLPRFDLTLDQVQRILSNKREEFCVTADINEIAQNPYVLAEQYVGENPDDVISFSKIDRGVFPRPNLGGRPLIEKDDWRRLRALLVDELQRETKHTFVQADRLIENINRRLSHLPDWRQHEFSERYLTVDEKNLVPALTFRTADERLFIYLKAVYEDERIVEQHMSMLANRGDIPLKSPVTLQHWQSFLHNPKSPIATRQPEEYSKAVAGQAQVCQCIFARPIAVVCGTAGTGKTTTIEALIKAIEKSHGSGTAIQLLAPTGKAADRLRTITQRNAVTVHSFLAEHGWLNPNLTFKRAGGRKEESFSTYIIDEASMLDLGLIAALFRAINWNSVQRLILVGDPNQLPPIGRGRLFADLIDWLVSTHDESLGELNLNIRQMENRLEGKGMGILRLASLYVRRGSTKSDPAASKADAEEMLRQVQEGGDVDKDLRVIYWRDDAELSEKLTATIVADMESDTKQKLDPQKPYQLWRQAFSADEDPQKTDPEYSQVLSPYRGDIFGVEHLNALLQKHAQSTQLDRVGTLGGITLFDKVIQYRNRGRSGRISAYNTQSQKPEQIEIYNGEIGFVKPHGLDRGAWKLGQQFWFRRFQVVFARKQKYWVNYGRDLGSLNGKPIYDENVEDNLELAYAISIHKAQGSEFERVYFIVPKHKRALLSTELFYTGMTRARRHCTLLIEEDLSPLLSMRRPEQSHLVGVSSSLFEFRPVADELLRMRDWYEEGRIHMALANIMVRSKSEVIIANLLTDRDLPFKYEMPLRAPDGTFYLPDFTVSYQGREYYWEHLGRLDDDRYREHWAKKQRWYDQFYPGQLITTVESNKLSLDAEQLIKERFPDSLSVTIGQQPTQDEILRGIIARGESATLEFKSSARWDIKQNQANKAMEQVIVKTVAAFLNSDGGTLLIGVDDAGKPIGLAHDYKTLGSRQDRDGYETWLTTLLLGAYGKDCVSFVRITLHSLDGQEICQVQAQRSARPVYVQEGNDEKLYVRAGNSTRVLSTREAVDYVRQRWG